MYIGNPSIYIPSLYCRGEERSRHRLACRQVYRQTSLDKLAVEWYKVNSDRIIVLIKYMCAITIAEVSE